MSKIIRNYPFKDYTQKEGVNSSSFQLIDPDRDGCPAIWKENLNEKTSDTPAMHFGRVLHKYILENFSFDKDYQILDQEKKDELFSKALADGSKAKSFSKALSSYKDWKKDCEDQGKEIVEEEALKTCESMRINVFKSLEPDVWEKLNDHSADTELSLFAELPDHRGNKVKCKGRIDAYVRRDNGNKKVIDLKTSISASPNHLARHIPKMKLYVQAAFYLDLLRACGEPCEEFWWMFIDKRKPYPCSYIRCDEGMIKLGRHEYRTWLGWIHDGLETDNWGWHNVGMIDYPQWFIDQIDSI